MSSPRRAAEMSEIARDLDMVVFKLERAPEDSPEAERDALRKELESLRDRLSEVVRAMEM